MQIPRSLLRAILCGLLFPATAIITVAQDVIWQVGKDDNTHITAGTGGGPDANFLQENGSVNALPGSNFAKDNDYYFAGIYDQIIAGNGDYFPLGNIEANEESAERAFVPTDTQWRVHFNLPDTLSLTNLMTVQFDMLNLDTGAANTDPRFGVEVWVNGVKVQDQIVIRPAQLNRLYKTPQFTLASVNAQLGAGFDNIVMLKGIPYDLQGGGSWMGIDYVQLNKEATFIPPPVFPWQVGKDDNTHATGDGGGTNTTFVQENGSTNALPGSAVSTEVAKGADDDYYFAGAYQTKIASVVTRYGDYEPIGVVSQNEEAAERAVVPSDLELRYHFNLPNTLKPTDRLAVTYEPLDLDNTAGLADPRFGMEVYINGVRIMTEKIIKPADLKIPVTTAPVTLASVNAVVGSGADNIVTLRGVPHNTEGGGSWMGIDYVKISNIAAPPPAPTLIWAVGINDDLWPTNGTGGGATAVFVQENGSVNALPGSAFNQPVAQQADNDYYLAGVYNTLIAGNGSYAPAGIISVSEEAVERALTTGDNLQRYHFNLPATVQPTNLFSIEFDAIDIDTSGGDAHMGVEVYVNNIKVLSEVAITAADLGKAITVPPFTAASVNIKAGEGFDNIVTLKGISYSGVGGGDWLGIDHIQFNPVLPPPFPWNMGKDDNAQSRAGNGGGATATMWQENGSINLLPGSPYSLERDQRNDNDYYFAGVYSNTIPEYVLFKGQDYTPVGTVVVNEEGGERAFAGGDRELRYHFNLPSDLNPTNELIVTFDAISLDNTAGLTDPRWGVEVYFNDVLVAPENIIRNTELGKKYTTAPFTIESGHGKVGPGFDNVVTLKGISYNGAEGGGNWMGIDFVQMDAAPVPVFPIQIGKADRTHITTGTGGGPNANFVQENGRSNGLPGNPANVALNQQADDDYYLAGFFTTIIPENGDYPLAGVVPRNEEAAERAFVPSDTVKRYHFNLPTSLQPTDKIQVNFAANNFDDRATATNPRWGVQVLFNGAPQGDMVVIGTNDLFKEFSTPAFTMQSVNAQTGLGPDNIVTLIGVPFNTDGGGDWMGIDYVSVTKEIIKINTATLDLAAGKINITWDGTANLQSAPAVTGPWSTLTTATSPYSETIQLGQNRFYRLTK
jgi:hypothetical protein